MTKKEQDYIIEFSSNREIISQFLVKNKEIKKSKNNKPYLELLLQDKTGQIKGRMFSNNSYKEYEKIEINNIYNIVGKIQEFPSYSGKYNILINRINTSTNYNPEDFIIEIKNLDEEIEFLNNTIKKIKNPHLTQILKLFFDDDIFKEKFVNAPAAKVYHHNFKGGLLIHTNEVIRICETISKIYEDIDGDLLITGAILHDIGKIETYDYETEDIEINNEGKLLEHLYIGASMLEKKLFNVDFPQELKFKLIHMILSHHGNIELGWGSAVDPKIPEAVALHQADDMSAKITISLRND